jgi:tubulin polyglutamylase TTLL5
LNKKNSKFIANESAESDDHGHKWSLSALCRHLAKAGVDLNLLWSKIYDVIIKSVIAIDESVCNALKKAGAYSRSNCFELFGFDILIDSDLK